MAELDPRSVANAIIRFAQGDGREVTNLKLQKIVYFAHGAFLSKFSLPLVSGYFEAWEYGPVHPVLYNCFKRFGRGPVTEMATKRDLATGRTQVVEEPGDRDLVITLRDIASSYLPMSAGRLVDLSHAPGSPWDVMTLIEPKRRAYGMRIKNEIIQERFRFHKVTVAAHPRIGEPDEELPPF